MTFLRHFSITMVCASSRQAIYLAMTALGKTVSLIVGVADAMSYGHDLQVQSTLVEDIQTQPTSTLRGDFNDDPMLQSNGVVVFMANFHKLYKIDGTAAGTDPTSGENIDLWVSDE